MKKASNSTSIKVFTRLRPLNRLEKEQGGECCVQYTDKAIKVKVAGIENPYDFGFDGIFGPESSQLDVFNMVAKPVIDGLIEGYNGTIFAYGQTSSGKTFTMEGPDVVDSDEALGIVPRMMKYLFDLIMNSSEDIEFQVKVSFLELYNEKLQDLIDPRKNNLQIKEDKSKGIFVQDVTEVYVSSAEQMRQVHKSGSENKTTAATRMNERSSRSHSIFILHVFQKDTKTDTTKHSKLFFVDLAGSEKIAKTNVTGQQLEEAKNINKSLTALGLVINALTEKDKGHVPYRDSKLTRMLQESLGGNSATSLILACSMCTYNDKETVDTLRFGNRAKSIKNTPVVNAERSAKELTILLSAAERKIQEQEALIEVLQAGGATTPLLKAATAESPTAVGSERKDSKEEENEDSKEEKPKNNQKGQSSLSLFKHQMEMMNLKEQMQELQGNNKDLESELAAKNQEIYDLNGKIMQYESQLSEFTNKNVLALEEYQVQFEKLYHENQEKAMVATKFKRAITRLKSDLSFMNVSKHLKVLEGHDNSSVAAGFETETTINTDSQANKDELIVNSIQKTIEILEEIERDIDQDDKKGASNEDVTNLIEALMKNSPTNSANNKTDLLLNNTPDEDLKPINWNDESSIDNRDVSDLLDSSKIDGDGEDDLVQKMQLQFQSLSEEDKVADLQGLVMNQRKTITNLTKLNAELTQINQKHQAAQDKNIQIYKGKLEELQKLNMDKVKEYESKLMSIKSLLERKVRELDENKMFYDRYLEEKTEQINELKEQNEKLQALIADSDVSVRNYELENAVREVTKERKKLQEDIMKLRKEADEKDDLISTKTGQIELLQNNLGLAAKELKMLKQLKPAHEANILEGNNEKSIKGGKSTGNSKNKGGFTLFDKHVVKPIRGGGGDANNFARNNLLVFDKKEPVAQVEEKASEKKSQNSGFFGFSVGGGSEESKSSKNKEKEEQSFKKFDDLLKNKGTKGSKSQKEGKEIKEVKEVKEGKEGEAMTTEPDQDEDLFDMGNVQQKLRRLTNKGVQAGSKNIKSLVSGMKNFFS